MYHTYNSWLDISLSSKFCVLVGVPTLKLVLRRNDLTGFSFRASNSLLLATRIVGLILASSLGFPNTIPPPILFSPVEDGMIES